MVPGDGTNMEGARHTTQVHAPCAHPGEPSCDPAVPKTRVQTDIVLFVKRACGHTTNTWRGIQTHCRRLLAPTANRIRPGKILKSVSSPRGSTRVPGSLPSKAGANRSNADRDGRDTGGRRLPVERSHPATRVFCVAPAPRSRELRFLFG